MRVRTTKIDIFIVCWPLNVDTLEKQLFLKRDWHWKLDLDGERQDGYSVMVTPYHRIEDNCSLFCAVAYGAYRRGRIPIEPIQGWGYFPSLPGESFLNDIEIN
jgi:hypothetical protein